MLERLSSKELRALAEKAGAVRAVRDRVLAGVREDAFGEEKPARGVHNPTADLGLDVVLKDNPARKALESALSALSPEAMRELWVVVHLGRGEYGVKDWERALAEANRLNDIGPDFFMGMADLHDHLMKAIYELERG